MFPLFFYNPFKFPPFIFLSLAIDLLVSKVKKNIQTASCDAYVRRFYNSISVRLHFHFIISNLFHSLWRRQHFIIQRRRDAGRPGCRQWRAARQNPQGVFDLYKTLYKTLFLLTGARAFFSSRSTTILQEVTVAVCRVSNARVNTRRSTHPLSLELGLAGFSEQSSGRWSERQLLGYLIKKNLFVVRSIQKSIAGMTGKG